MLTRRLTADMKSKQFDLVTYEWGYYYYYYYYY